MDDTITFENGAVDNLEDQVERINPHKTVMITDQTIEDIWLDKVRKDIDAETIIIPEGERYKNISTVQNIWKELIELDVTRRSLIIGFGGGVITDLSAFASSTFKRGTFLGLIPTTLIGQIDAAIGGKTGFNFEGKNMIGTFHDPDFVIIDPDLLSTLPEEEVINGFGEILKYGIIDKEIFDILENMNTKRISKDLLKLCISKKIEIVKQDREEKGVRRLLNLGHTVGHGLERESDHCLKHGEAVGLGLLASAILGERRYDFDRDLIKDLLEKFDLPTKYSFEINRVIDNIRNDKKRWFDNNVMVIPKDIGEVKIEPVDISEIKSVLKGLRGRYYDVQFYC